MKGLSQWSRGFRRQGRRAIEALGNFKGLVLWSSIAWSLGWTRWWFRNTNTKGLEDGLRCEAEAKAKDAGY